MRPAANGSAGQQTEASAHRRQDTAAVEAIATNGSDEQQTEASAHRRCAVLGTGIMGSRIACRFAQAGYSTVVYNRTQERARELEASGIIVASTPAEASAEADVVVICLADPSAVRTVVLNGPDAALPALKSGAALIDTSTGSPALARELSRQALAQGVDFLECPVTGSKIGAEQGTLTAIVGGDDATVQKLTPVLEVFAKAIVHIGPVGTASTVKLIGNAIIAHMIAGLCEGFAVARHSGIAPEKVLEVISKSGYASPYFEFKGRAILANDFDTHFSINLLHKDLSLFVEEANTAKTTVFAAAAIRDLFSAARALGLGECDIAAVDLVFPHPKT